MDFWFGSKNGICNMENRDCRNDITPDSTINRRNDTCDTVDNYVNSVDYFIKEDKRRPCPPGKDCTVRKERRGKDA